jgi:hypothetical protein
MRECSIGASSEGGNREVSELATSLYDKFSVSNAPSK